MAVILTPSRPLWPWRMAFSMLEPRFPGKAIVVRARNVYSAYANRHDLFAPLLASLPPEAMKLGWIAGGAGLETDIWRPFGSHTVERVQISDSMESMMSRGIRFAVMNRNVTPSAAELDTWLQNHHAKVISEQGALLTQAKGVEQFVLVRIEDQPPNAR